MADLLEFAGRRDADLARGGILADQFRKARLDRVIALTQRIIFGVGNARRIVLVVALVMLGQNLGEPFQLGRGLLLGQGFGLGKIGEFLRHNAHNSNVMAGFMPAIHALLGLKFKDVEAKHNSGLPELCILSVASRAYPTCDAKAGHDGCGRLRSAPK
jgi:hypothetical protein